MANYRILSNGDEFMVQERGLLFWRDCYEFSWYGAEKPLLFKTQEEAEKYIDDKRKQFRPFLVVKEFRE